jgi:hypothetical protein
MNVEDEGLTPYDLYGGTTFGDLLGEELTLAFLKQCG